MTTRTAILIGATGLVGGHCLSLLLGDDDYGKVVTIGRRSLPATHAKLVQHVVDFERLAEYSDLIRGRDVFCCLGTTIRKAGSQEAFRRVDFTYQYELAEIAARNGAEQLLLVSSIGANPRSRVFYSRVKGELEAAVCGLPFGSVNIFRPSLLLGERAESRAGERTAGTLLRYTTLLLAGPLRKYRPIQARVVAEAMVGEAKGGRRGVNVFESDEVTAMVSKQIGGR